MVVHVRLLITSFSHVDPETELTVKDTSCNSLTVEWTTIPEAEGYNLQYKPQSMTENWKRIDTIETIFEINKLLPSTKYAVKVRGKQTNRSFAKANFTTLPRTGMQVYGI